MAPKLIILLMSSGSKKKDPRYTCLSEAEAECGPRFHPLLHISYTVDRPTAPLDEDVSQGIMFSEKARNSPGLCPVKRQKPSLGTQTGSQN